MENQWTSINDYYNFIEDKLLILGNMDFIAKELDKNCSSFDQDDIEKIRLELDCIFSEFKDSTFIDLKNRNNMNKSTNNLVTQEELDYLITRVSSTNNDMLKSVFSHIIWLEKLDISYAEQAIDSYFNLVNTLLELDKNEPDKMYGIEICETYQKMQDLIIRLGKRVDDFQKLLLDIIHNPNTATTSFLKLRLDSMRIITDKCKSKKFQKNCLADLESICENMTKMDLNIPYMILYLDLGIDISRLTGNSTINWNRKKAEYFEKLSNEYNGSVIAPEFCQKAIELYQNLKDENKVEELKTKYLFLCKSIKMEEINVQTEYDMSQNKENIKDFVKNNSSDEILKYLTYSNEVVPKYEDIEKSAYKILKNGVLHHITQIILNDVNGHKIGQCSTEEEYLNFYKIQSYVIHFQIMSLFYSELIKDAISENKLNSQTIIDYLRKTGYGLNIAKPLINNSSYTYTWLDFIKPAITDFLDKFEQAIKDNSPLVFIPEIDSLTLKIEGIIRDIAELNNLDQFKAYKFNAKQTFNWRNINDYLYDEAFSNFINEDELHFMRFFLIDYGNIRNKVAHCLMVYPEYHVYVMTYIFILILRLSKYLVNK